MNEEIPDDVLEELKEISKELEKELIRRPRRKIPYPSTRDIARAIIETTKIFQGESPDDFPEEVRRYLRNLGYDTRHVTDKRIWRMYEIMARKGVIRDALGVVSW